MASQGPNSAGAGANQTGVGTVAWSNPENVAQSDDTYATAFLFAGGGTYHLVCSSFGFSIPSGATIDGIVAEVEQAQITGSPGNLADLEIKIVKGGVIGATNKAANVWPDVDAYAVYGGSSDLWGEEWTAEDVNASGFGVAVSALSVSVKGAVTAAVDHVRMTVYYTEGASSAAASATMGLMGVG